MKKLGQEWNRRIFIACSILSVPFLIRAFYNFLAAILHLDAHVMIPSIKNDDWTAPLVYLIYISLADIMPITGQLISMLVVLDHGKYQLMASSRKGSIEKKNANKTNSLDIVRSNKRQIESTNMERSTNTRQAPRKLSDFYTQEKDLSEDSNSSDSGDLENVIHLGIFSADPKKHPLIKFTHQDRSRMERSNSQTITYKSIIPYGS